MLDCRNATQVTLEELIIAVPYFLMVFGINNSKISRKLQNKIRLTMLAVIKMEK